MMRTISRIRACALLALLIAAGAWQQALGQLTTVIDKAGESYGISGWVLVAAGQTKTDNQPGGYGINIKYGPENVFLRDRDSTRAPKCDACCCPDNPAQRDSIWKYKDSTFYLRFSFGLGYLSYTNLKPPTGDLGATIDAGGPYAGIYASVPIYAVDDSKKPWLSLVVGYTSAVVSSKAVLGTYTGAAIQDKSGASRTNFQITYDLPTTVIHEVNAGFSFARRVFVTGSYHIFKARDVLYKPIDDAIPTHLLQGNLSGDMDLSFWSLKAGLSFDF